MGRGDPEKIPSFHNFGRERASWTNGNIRHITLKSNKRDRHEKTASHAIYKLEDTNNSILGGFGEAEPAKSIVKHRPQRNDRSSKEVTAVPDPIPDTGFDPSYERPPGIAGHRTSSFLTNTGAKAAPSTSPSGSTMFSPLPPLITASPFSALPTSTVILSPSSTLSSFTTSATTVDWDIHQAQHKSSHMIPTAVIALLAVGSAFALSSIFIIIRFCSRPRKRAHPTPSLPILEKEFQDNVFATESSPVFGGKERYSPVSSGMWSWHQHTIKKPAPAAGYGRIIGNEGSDTGNGTKDEGYYDEKNQHLIAATPAPTNINRAPIVQPAQAAPTHAASRLSATSMSTYPNPPVNGNEVGIAVDGVPPFTADGLAVIKRTKSKGGGLRASMIARGNTDRETVYSQYSQGFAYGGADVRSPVPPATSLPIISITPAAATGGRSRIKSTYYAPGAYPRSSNAMSSWPAAQCAQNPFQDSQYHLSESHHGRDALTSALGLHTPEISPPSPQPTLYPEDSISDAGRDSVPPLPSVEKRTHKKPVLKPSISAATPQHVLPSPSTETGATLGNLMLTDFGTTASLAYLKDPPASSSCTSLTGKAHKKLVSDKPPRVPSPPTFPSLTQMGLAHANPEGYADYRSPTYSIYGLYQSSDRKSRVNSFGY